MGCCSRALRRLPRKHGRHRTPCRRAPGTRGLRRLKSSRIWIRESGFDLGQRHTI
ncbi:hypothetical protein ACFPRL_17205 [Pseudoclavibacter helvolus]